MAWEERARKLEAKTKYMPKHGYSLFVIEAAERKRAAEGKHAVGDKARREAAQRLRSRRHGRG